MPRNRWIRGNYTNSSLVHSAKIHFPRGTIKFPNTTQERTILCLVPALVDLLNAKFTQYILEVRLATRRMFMIFLSSEEIRVFCTR